MLSLFSSKHSSPLALTAAEDGAVNDLSKFVQVAVGLSVLQPAPFPAFPLGV